LARHHPYRRILDRPKPQHHTPLYRRYSLPRLLPRSHLITLTLTVSPRTPSLPLPHICRPPIPNNTPRYLAQPQKHNSLPPSRRLAAHEHASTHLVSHQDPHVHIQYTLYTPYHFRSTSHGKRRQYTPSTQHSNPLALHDTRPYPPRRHIELDRQQNIHISKSNCKPSLLYTIMIQLSQTQCDHRFRPVRHKPHLQFLLSRNSQPSSNNDMHISPPPCIDVTSTPAKIALLSCLAWHISQFQSSLPTDSQPDLISQPDHHFAASFGTSLKCGCSFLPPPLQL
jgi:hypothetical protein